MTKPSIPLDPKSEKLLKQVNQLLDELLTANSGTALSVVQPRLHEAIDMLAKYRYTQVGVTEPQ